MITHSECYCKTLVLGFSQILLNKLILINQHNDIFYDAYEYISPDQLIHESSSHDMQALSNIGSSDFETRSL